MANNRHNGAPPQTWSKTRKPTARNITKMAAATSSCTPGANISTSPISYPGFCQTSPTDDANITFVPHFAMVCRNKLERTSDGTFAGEKLSKFKGQSSGSVNFCSKTIHYQGTPTNPLHLMVSVIFSPCSLSRDKSVRINFHVLTVCLSGAHSQRCV